MTGNHGSSRDLTGSDPITYNITLVIADTEYSQVIPQGTHKYEIQCRTPYAVRFEFESGYVATPTNPYSTLKPNTVHWEDNMDMNNMTIYLASSEAGVVVELRTWT